MARKKKRFELKLDCENAAFEDDMRGEIATILREIATKVEHGALGDVVRDANGNRVGYFELIR